MLAGVDGPITVDSLGTWVASRTGRGGRGRAVFGCHIPFRADGDRVGRGRDDRETQVGRRFRDVLGEVSQRVAEIVDRLMLVSWRAGWWSSSTRVRRGRRSEVVAALGFLTTLGRPVRPSPRRCVVPVVGAVVGGAVGLVWWGAEEIWPPLVAAALAAADLALTGLLHVDGTADSADGLRPRGSGAPAGDHARPARGSVRLGDRRRPVGAAVVDAGGDEPQTAAPGGALGSLRASLAAVPLFVPYARDEAGLRVPRWSGELVAAGGHSCPPRWYGRRSRLGRWDNPSCCRCWHSPA